MPIQFADHPDLPFPDLFARPSAPFSSGTALHKTHPDAQSARSVTATMPRRQPRTPTLDTGLLRFHPFADAALRPFLEAASEAEAQEHLQALIQRIAAPIIARIIRRKWHVTPNRAHGSVQRREEWEAEDLYSDALVQLVTRLRACREDKTLPAITCFAAYVARMTARVCVEHFRRASPERERCRQRLRRLLKTHLELAAWRDDWNRATCGLKAWQGRNPSRTALQRLTAWEAQAHSANDSEQWLTEKGLANLLTWLGGSVPQEKLVGALYAVTRLSDAALRSPDVAREWQAEEDSMDPLENLKDARVDVEVEVEQRVFLRRLWTEILALPSRQRAALLLNLRDAQNRGVLALLTHAQIATRTEIARALGFSDAELGTLLPALPLEDGVIAEWLSCTPQQVSNLRKSARARLSRRADRYDVA